MPGLKWPTPNLMWHRAQARGSLHALVPFVKEEAANCTGKASASLPFQVRTLQECKSPTERPMKVCLFKYLNSGEDGIFRAVRPSSSPTAIDGSPPKCR